MLLVNLRMIVVAAVIIAAVVVVVIVKMKESMVSVITVKEK